MADTTDNDNKPQENETPDSQPNPTPDNGETNGNV